MKHKIKSLFALSAGLMACAHAQTNVAGWDFSPYAVTVNPGFSSIDAETLTGVINANFTQGLPEFVEAQPFGTLYYDGSFGSTAFDLNTKEIEPNNDLGTLGGNGEIGASGNINTLTAQGQEYGFGNALGLTTNGAITIAIDLTGFELGSSAESWSLAFATQNNSDSDNSSSIAWDYSLDGSEFVSTGITTAITQNAAAQSVDLSGIEALDGQTEVFFRGTFSGVDDGVSYIDNLQVNAEFGGGSTGGSLFILDNPASETYPEINWWATPMGDLFVGLEPWLYSAEYGWTYSRPENTEESAFVYIRSAPFETWVFVDQNSATANGFWGYAYDAVNTDINGWYWFFNVGSTANGGKYFLWDSEGAQVLEFDDQSASQ